MSPVRRLVLALTAVLLVASTACSKESFEDRTAVVDVDGASTTFTLDTCGLDDTTVFVVGRSTGGATLQVVVGVEEEDHEAGIPDLTGISVTDADSDRVAFGSGAWSQRDETSRPPGRIDEARIRGARIQVSGAFETLEPSATPSDTAGTLTPFSFDARCDEPS